MYYDSIIENPNWNAFPIETQTNSLINGLLQTDLACYSLLYSTFQFLEDFNKCCNIYDILFMQTCLSPCNPISVQICDVCWKYMTLLID